jgi:hypothetical protein
MPSSNGDSNPLKPRRRRSSLWNSPISNTRSGDCSKAPAAILTITAEGAILKLHAAGCKSLALIGADDFSCDWRDRQVTVNYKPNGSANGDVISLEMR